MHRAEKQKCSHPVTTCRNTTLYMSSEQCFGQGWKIDRIVTGPGRLAATERGVGLDLGIDRVIRYDTSSCDQIDGTNLDCLFDLIHELYIFILEVGLNIIWAQKLLCSCFGSHHNQTVPEHSL